MNTTVNPKERPSNQAKALPVLQRAPKPITPVRQSGWTYHRERKAIHTVCVLVFITLPFLNLMRFDIPHQRFYFLGYELWINEFAIIFFTLMFLLFVIVAASMLYGRVYCGYLCPQMIFSEASLALEEKFRRLVQKRFIRLSPGKRLLISRSLFYSALAIISIFLAFVFIAYFVEPLDLFQRLVSLDIKTAGGIAGAATTLLTFLDFTFVRQRFCKSVCPYGYLQGMLGDHNTLIVHYRDAQQDCIECKKCVRICHMGIDIRRSPYQMECIHCGECIDACADVLGRFGKPGLIHYTWGEEGEKLGDKTMSWRARLGLRDAKRLAVLAVIFFYAAGLTVALSLRHNVLVKVAPIRTTLYRVGEDGRIYNQFRMTLANRGSRAATVTLTVKGLDEARMLLENPALTLQPGETLEGEFEIVAPFAALPTEVNHFAVESQVAPYGESDRFEMTFIRPLKKNGRE
jgi:polyferredoxin